MLEKLQLPIQELGIDIERQQAFSEIFHYTRDLPFDCGQSPEKPISVTDSNRILETYGRGGCTAKHYLLGTKLEALNFDTKYLTFPFKWDDLQIAYPDDLRQLAEQMPTQYHCALGIIFEDQACLLDVTWDKQLAQAGFTINQGLSLPTHNILGIVPCGEPIMHQTSQERWNYILGLKKQMLRNEIVPLFYESLNQWLQSLRS